MESNRWTVLNRSQSAHCCFEFSVVDKTTEHFLSGAVDKSRPYYRTVVCECFDEQDANLIAKALNFYENKNQP